MSLPRESQVLRGVNLSLVEKEKGETYYLARVKTDRLDLQRNGKSYPIIPGMVASVEIMTGRKTVLSF
jgi:adhesin transport system membrane fusion protein